MYQDMKNNSYHYYTLATGAMPGQELCSVKSFNSHISLRPRYYYHLNFGQEETKAEELEQLCHSVTQLTCDNTEAQTLIFWLKIPCSYITPYLEGI